LIRRRGKGQWKSCEAAQLCIVTGTLTALTSAIGRFVSDPSRLAETSDDPAAVINGVVALIASLLLVFVLLALYGEHREPRGGHRLGPVGLIVALVGTVLLAGDFWFEAFVVPYLADVAPAALGGDPGGALLVGAVSSFIVFAVGWLLFGIEAYRVGRCHGRR